MANSSKWSITNDSTSPAIGNDLNGLRIKKTSSGYELYAVLAKVDDNTPPFTFSGVNFDGQTWNITVTQLPGSGTWEIPNPVQDEPIDGDFTSQATGGDEDAEAASSAKA